MGVRVSLHKQGEDTEVGCRTYFLLWSLCSTWTGEVEETLTLAMQWLVSPWVSTRWGVNRSC